MTFRRCGLAPAVVLAAAASLALPSPVRPQYETPPPPPSEPGPSPDRIQTFEGGASVILVEVPVTVVHHGKSLEGFTAEDFELFDRGERQEIESFEVLTVESAARRAVEGGAESSDEAGGATAAPDPAARRNFLFLFDLAYAGSRSLASTAGILEALLDEGIVPGDRVGIGYFSAVRGYRWILGLTDRHGDVRRGLDLARAMIESDRPRAEALLEDWREPTDVVPAGARLDRRALLAEAGLTWHNRDVTVWPVASTVRELSRGLTRVVEATASLDGRKYLVHLSRGAPDGPAGERALVLSFFQDIKRACRSSGWAIQSVDMGGLGFGRDSLLMMALDTGGQLFTNSNDVQLLLREMEATTRTSYLLTFQPRELEPDGGFHRLEVKVRNKPSGARVVHRPGYYAPRAGQAGQAGEAGVGSRGNGR
jgi:VWFA-related protein